MEFDNQKHADVLLEASGLICSALMLCEGIEFAHHNIDSESYISAAAGSFGLMTFALNRVIDLMNEAETDFRLSHGMNYPAHSGGGSPQSST